MKAKIAICLAIICVISLVKGHPNYNAKRKVTESSKAIGLFNKRFVAALNTTTLKRGSDISLLKRAVFQQLDKRTGETAEELCSDDPISCDQNAKYRRIDGRCNNLRNPRWGSSGIAMRRFVEPAYSDGISTPYGTPTAQGRFLKLTAQVKPKQCQSDAPNSLPQPRYVSKMIHHECDVSSNVATHMLTQFGQFLDHDITFTPEAEIHDCCESEEEECFNIEMPVEDNFYGQFGKRCLGFARSQAFCHKQNEPREQFNAITAFIDASNVYGETKEKSDSLRLMEDGLLKTSNLDGGLELLPLIDDEYTAGDIRSQEMPGLSSMHTLWLREHNRLAKTIKSRDSSLDDETIFQEARRLLIAEMQNVVYTEFLPILLGKAGMRRFNLNVPDNGRTKYYATKDPSILNEFASAAFRYGHSMIQSDIIRFMKSGQQMRSYALRDNFFQNTHYVEESGRGVEFIFNGLMRQPSQTCDASLEGVLRDFLFREPQQDFGGDLVARNLQRAREHGIPGYNHFRAACGMVHACYWDRAPAEFEPSVWERLSRVYDNPGDIDLFTAGLAEKPHNGGLLGRTFTCILGEQFRLLKDGDRFFFSHKDQAGSLTDSDLAEIKGRKFSDIICDNLNNENVDMVRENVFDLRSPMKRC